MPKYVYRCTDCRRQEEYEFSMSFQPAVAENCNCGGMMRKIITGAAIHFKGRGFYSTGG